jgi:aminoglycoside phosphotransferase (APT) family kinase protein
MTAESDERTRAIAARLQEVLGEPLSAPVTRLSSGASRHTLLFATPSRGELVLQSDRHASDPPRPRQAPLFVAAAQAGVPVPRVIADGEDDAALGPRWIVVQALAGTSDPRRILSGEDVPAAPALLDDIAAALAAVHRMPAEASLAPAVEDSLGDLRRMHDALGEPHPTFELAFRALREGPPAAPRALVHGDFRMGNLMVAREGLSGVLDWELTHVGDPVEDLGWLCVPAWRFGRRERPAAGLGSREELLAAYERHAHGSVDPAALAWWELAGTLRWGVICVMQAFTHLSGATRSVEHAVIGRRACEVEWDLLEMLDPEGAAAALAAAQPQPSPDDAAPRSLHDRPTALELLSAARGALGDEVLPQLQGRAAFELRVSLRALGMVARELSLAQEHAALHAHELSRLGCASERELAEAIREGHMDARIADVHDALRAIVRAKLDVANPGYPGARPHRGGKEDA